MPIDSTARHETSSADRSEHLRRKTTALFLGGVGVGSVGLIAAITVSTLAAQEISKAATWSGFPSGLSILGTALGTTLLAEAMQRWGRRKGLLWSYCLAVLGAVLAVVAVIRGSLALLLGAMFLIGLGRSGDALSRYLVADLYPVGRRASAIGWLVWMGTIGAILGPNSLGPSGRLAVNLGLPRLAGAYLVTLGAYGLVVLLYFIFLRPDPSTLVYEEGHSQGAAEPIRFTHLFRNVNVQLGLAVLVVGQTVMVLIMTMTPLYLKLARHGLGAIGLVMSSHIVGMFIFSTLTGRAVDRWGRLPVILVGQVTLLVAAVSAMLAPVAEVGLVAAALFLLGLGWNLGFVAGSALLSSGIPLRERSRLQGVTDSLIWSSAALASALSGLVLAALGYDALCVIGALLLAIPSAVMLRHRKSLARPH